MAMSGGNVREDFLDTYLSVRFELLKHLKRRRLIILAPLALFAPLLFYIGHPDTAAELSNIGLGFVSFLTIIAAAMFAGDAVCGESEKKTSLLSFPTPQRRSSIFAGKYIAALMSTWVVVLLWYVSMTLQTAQRLKRSITSTILGLVSLLMVLPIFSMIMMVLDREPWFILTYSANVITSVLGVASSLASHGEGINISSFTPTYGTAIAVMAGYAVVFLVAGMVLAVRRSRE
ncbi:MAG: hypothetical protein NTU41_13950 [Chloroflexi bacterium]|nr:hypothetical protein [Chloroflexota bacterium]